jgi:regulator of protease activity HflC (stomatin/prohibitin superfamily)
LYSPRAWKNGRFTFNLATSAPKAEKPNRGEQTVAQPLAPLLRGIRDVLLPGEMKTLLNRVTEAKKSAEANLIVRREETAAMRSQANTAKLLEGNPTLMRLRELEILEKVAASSKLNVVLGEKGLAERVVNLL